MSEINEFENSPVTPDKLEPGRYFAASYAGEHVAGTEFVIGALFVSLGVSTIDIFVGLAVGNLLAVLTWAWVCAPIAIQTRLTLYAYLEKIAGPRMIRIYSIANGVLFCVLAGAMITVSASAVRIPFNIPPQTTWYPTSISFVLVAVVVGAVISYVAISGFKRVAQFAEVCAPWMILMFLVGSLAALPLLIGATEGLTGISGFADFVTIGDQYIWVEKDNGIGAWHVAGFAWICNISMHGGLSDMTILRYARKVSYGYLSALGMFIGHYMAWICAGIMGAAAAMILKSSITQLDAGEVAYQVLGWAGILAVVIAGWTTSNPTIYRAGLAFQSLNPKWNRVRVTAVVGIITTIIACFPFVFSKLLDLLGIMGLAIVPIGAIIFTEHWLFPRLGLTRYWHHYSGGSLNMPALVAWIGSLLVAIALNQWFMVHIFFLLIPTWIAATLLYIAVAAPMGARRAFPQEVAAELENYRLRKEQENKFLQLEKEAIAISHKRGRKDKLLQLSRIIAISSLFACIALGIWAYISGYEVQNNFRNWLIVPTVSYFIFGILWMREKENIENEEIDHIGVEKPAAL